MSVNERDIQAEVEAAARELVGGELPTVEELDRYGELVSQLPVPDFRPWAKQEQERNTPRWQDAVRSVEEKLTR